MIYLTIYHCHAFWPRRFRKPGVQKSAVGIRSIAKYFNPGIPGLGLIFLLFCFQEPANAQLTADTIIRIQFATNQAEPDAKTTQVYQSKLKQLSSTGAQILYIAGHTDTTGPDSYNQILSQKRAQNIARFCQNLSVHPDYALQYYGESQPLGGNLALNRRVEIGLRFPIQVTEAAPIPKTTNPKDSLAQHTLSEKTRLTLDQLYFKADKAELESFSLGYMQEVKQIVAGFLKKYPGAQIEIRGHVNCPKRFEKDKAYMQRMQELSQKRAELIHHLLIDSGIPVSNLRFKGMSNSEMIFPAAQTEKEMRKNMRVEIIVLTQ